VSEKIEAENPQKFIHRLIFLAAIATPIMTLPQVYQIWVLHQKGASAVTWVSYVFIAFIWLYYGIENRDKPIIIMQSLCIVVYSAVVLGLILK
jgi:MtN3 and saliva related transmembrane protein